MILLSHSTPATRFSYHDLAARLSSRGFIVAAPTHTHDNLDNMDDLFTWNQLKRRTEEISFVLATMLADKALSPCIDAEKIGYIGFGAGGSAGLLLGGALPNCDTLNSFCQDAGSSSPYCTPITKEKLNIACQAFPLRESLANPRIKAMVIVAPGFGMFFDKSSFRHFYPPVLLVSAGRDKFNPPAFHSEPLARILGKKARYLDLPNADTGALTSSCPPALASELPELCESVSVAERASLRESMAKAIISFFSWYLLDKAHRPDIPSPPDLSRPEVKKLAPEPCAQK